LSREAAYLRAQAHSCCRVADTLRDPRTAAALRQVARNLLAKADELERMLDRVMREVEPAEPPD
jgi:hypothetical protein